ncbi:protein YfiR [Yersinia thracica]|uniref:Protein YfiR n=1 Tax=Yersinia thracica TaxID=2890319 RepID=A0A0T9PAC7_9GAMM|nr:YfiR family protein [Yersinia thracica]CNH54323.1 protein YfiR [Yersinia thracica]
MNTAPCAISGINDGKHHYLLKLITPRHIWRRSYALTLLFILTLFASLPSIAANNLSTVNNLGAVNNLSAELIHERSDAATKMVLGIISYSRWPTPPPVIRLCVIAPTNYAEELFNPALMQTAHPIKTQRYSLPNAALASNCDVAYLGSMGEQQRQELTTQLSGYPILTISEDYAECTLGSAFCLLLDDKQASFKVNMDALARAGVRVHPNVLQLARKKADAL